jgi:hypothetical protein
MSVLLIFFVILLILKGIVAPKATKNELFFGAIVEPV